MSRITDGRAPGVGPGSGTVRRKEEQARRMFEQLVAA